MNEMMVLPRRRNLSEENGVEDLELPLMEFEAVLTATENFSECNKVGEGGFGAVYKGRLLDGQEIAVKRLSEMSAQGLTRSCMLNWQMRFDIINGIARGLLYLHQDSSIRIIHRDLKASNVLLDKDMNPKISDFGMARIFGQNETEANTRKVVGTYGYMSPEYLIEGRFSIKSDVYSFGVLLLEIISGKRNKAFNNSGCDHNLLDCVWRNWKEGQGLEIVVDTANIDSSSSPTFRPHEILRFLQIGLLCVQERAEDRPLMSNVVLMLGSEAEDIPQPKPPGYCIIGNHSTWCKQRDHESCTVNQITNSIIDAR
ncbi:Receptor-like serine/threonine-protein kinase SD1-8 [Raphanus sativus]|nr:Receptor-like serine/threonine-protein kinase SD1-8 [Raphanus sativus]